MSTSGQTSSARSSSFTPTGVWSLGMRLFGHVSFTVKASLIALAFLVPMAFLAWSFYATQNANIAFSAKERVGVAYNREVLPVLDLAQQWRRDAVAAAGGQAPATLADVKAKLQQAQSRLADVEKLHGAELGTSKAYAAVQSAYAAAGAAQGAEAVFSAHTAHTEALMALLLQATDASNLTLDPDIDSYYLMDAVFFRVPDIAESSSKLRIQGLSVLTGGPGTQAFSEALPIAEFQYRNMRDGLAKSYAYNGDLSSKVRSAEPLADAEAFFTLARQLVIGGQDTSAEAQTRLSNQGSRAVAAQFELSRRLLDELDVLLEVRIDGMTSKRTTVSVVLVLGLLAAGYFFICFFRVANGGLQVLAQHLDEVSEGDLRNRPAQPWGSDETAAVLRDLAKTYDSLYGLIRKVRHGARELHTASNEIASASTDLGARTEASVAALEEQASAMEEISSTVGNTAHSAQNAAEFATGNAEVAQKAGAFIHQVVDTMQEIHASSSKINDIIGVIDGIAFQTNILALNAAVEAARAGEAGRGFAVVAAEVRQLAQRSAGAAKEIKGLISDSVDKIDSGTRIVQGAGSTMTEVVENAKQINMFLKEIATSAREQASGVEQVGQSIQELDRSTQQNAALVEETTSAAAALRHQAEVLQQEIANFRVA